MLCSAQKSLKCNNMIWSHLTNLNDWFLSLSHHESFEVLAMFKTTLQTNTLTLSEAVLASEDRFPHPVGSPRHLACMSIIGGSRTSLLTKDVCFSYVPVVFQSYVHIIWHIVEVDPYYTTWLQVPNLCIIISSRLWPEEFVHGTIPTAYR